MPRRSAPHRTTTTHATERPRGELLRRLCLAAAVALLVATPLVPSESIAALGSSAVLIMLWLVLWAAWLLSGFLDRQLLVRAGATAWAVAALVLWQAVSGFAMAGQGSPRATLNVVWQWFALALSFFLFRQLLRPARAARAVTAVLVGLSVGLGGFGLYQYFVLMPETLARYEREPEQVLREAEVEAPPGSPERYLFEARLRSVEPFATFALTNSLAAFLTPWLLTTLGIAAAGWNEQPLRRAAGAVALLAVLLTGSCLVLTKSRSSYAALLFGLVLLGLAVTRLGLRITWRAVFVGVLIMALLLVAAVAVGGVDVQVLSEAPKSLLYRLQYWRAGMAIVADHPWFGTGPGNFQQYYTQYKLPAASETVADPHNLVLEVWSTAGTPALLAAVAVALAAAWQYRTGRRQRTNSGPPPGKLPSAASSDAAERPDASADNLLSAGWIYGGAVAGTVLAVLYGAQVGLLPDLRVMLFVVPLGALVIWLLHGWVREGTLPAWLPALAAAVMLINLLGAGGTSYPGVAQSLWLLLALSLNLSESAASGRRFGYAALLGCLVVAAILAALAYVSLYRPAVTGRQLLNAGMRSERQGRVERAEQSYAEAARIDPFAAAPWQQLARLAFGRWQAAGGERHREAFVEATEEVLRRERRSAQLRRSFGELFLRAYLRTGDERDIEAAVSHFEAAVELYPNSNLYHALLAWAAHLDGRSQQAQQAASRALELDALNPHAEQRLARQLPLPGAARLGSADSPPPGVELLMQQLRK